MWNCAVRECFKNSYLRRLKEKKDVPPCAEAYGSRTFVSRQSISSPRRSGNSVVQITGKELQLKLYTEGKSWT